MPRAPFRRWFVWLAILAVLYGLAAAPSGQAVAQPAPNGGTVGPAGPAAQLRQKLDAIRIELDQIEAGLGRPGLSDKALQELRRSIEPLADQARTVALDLTPRGDAIRLRLKELGPKPGEKDPPESADVTREREDRQASLADVDETVRLARALIVQAEQLEKSIADMRRSLFTDRLFETSESILSPTLWLEIARGLPDDAKALSLVTSDAVDRAVSRLTPRGALFVLGALALAMILILPVRRFGVAFVKRDRLAGHPTTLQKALAAAGLVTVSAALPFFSAYLVNSIVAASELLPPRLEPVARSLLFGIGFVAFVVGLADALLAPDRSNWRLYSLSDDKAQRLVRVIAVIALIAVTGRFVETILHAIAASLKLSVALQGVFAVLTAVAAARALPLIRSVSAADEAVFGPHVSDGADFTGVARGVGWTLVASVVTAAVFGYVALASFMADQFIWAAIVIPLVMLCIVLASEGIATAFSATGAVSRAARSSIGLSRQSMEQVGVLASGAARVALLVLGLLLLLAPWGVESRDVLSQLKAAFFGITIGGVTVSLSTIMLAVVFFGVGIFVTRTVQRWLQSEYLPRTKMDGGLRNSITTAVGYIGVLGAGAFAVSYLGLSFDKLTIVAGALSVGIGFGLQSIVSNFVSGLILLAERPVKVGDWVVVGDEQGYVKRINVRATQIETFDRATLIVPNSTLITGTVKNWVHSDRVGRIIVTIPVPRDADSDMVATILRAAAQEHPDVLDDPPPRVLFKRITETALTFDLICFVGEVDMGARVSSELTFAIVRRLRETGVIKPAGPAKLEVDGIFNLQDEVARLRAAIDAQMSDHVAQSDPDFLPTARKPKT